MAVDAHNENVIAQLPDDGHVPKRCLILELVQICSETGMGVSTQKNSIMKLEEASRLLLTWLN